jgi:outer membrane protein assembly factor BamE
MRLFHVLLAALGLALAGCNIVYKQEIRQGNPLTPEMIAGLKAGMTKRQVRLLLGSPSISDTFHADRWDYVYYTGKANEPQTVPAPLTLYFKDDKLVRAEGSQAPATLPIESTEPAATKR